MGDKYCVRQKKCVTLYRIPDEMPTSETPIAVKQTIYKLKKI